MNLKQLARRAYKRTDLYQLDKLMAEETRWKRKATIAGNKLAEVRTRINKLAVQLCREKAGVTDEKTNQST